MTARKRAAAGLLVLCAGALLLLRECSELPPLENRTVSAALTETDDTRLGRAIAPLARANPGASGILPLRDAREAFAVRALLAQAAERSLDIQYYIWRNDMTGTLMFEALHAAADRGVRVRLLLDDNNTSGLDATLAALDAHPNIEVRLFNPFVLRDARLLGYAFDFFRLNRRMHNKSFTADSRATIIGGRNIGDEYFDAADGVLFADLDVLAVGPVVPDVSSDFDAYWASDSAYPADRLLEAAEPGALAGLSAAAARIEADPRAAPWLAAVRDSSLIRDLVDGTLTLEWSPAHLVSDDPAKGLGDAPPNDGLLPEAKAIIGEPAHHLDLVSPYFVPTASGVDIFTRMAGRGVDVRILVNSLEATDVSAVHSGYAKWREPLLEAGITLYEVALESPAHPVRAGPFGSSGTSLHAKTFAVDGSRFFVGSFNFDPRSANLNTEMGIVIDSPDLARQVDTVFDEEVPLRAYEVRLSDTGEVYWIERREGEPVRHETEPGTTFWQRAGVWFLSLLPIEGLL